jgi:hypothetical protein
MMIKYKHIYTRESNASIRRNKHYNENVHSLGRGHIDLAEKIDDWISDEKPCTILDIKFYSEIPSDTQFESVVGVHIFYNRQ